MAYLIQAVQILLKTGLRGWIGILEKLWTLQFIVFKHSNLNSFLTSLNPISCIWYWSVGSCNTLYHISYNRKLSRSSCYIIDCYVQDFPPPPDPVYVETISRLMEKVKQLSKSLIHSFLILLITSVALPWASWTVFYELSTPATSPPCVLDSHDWIISIDVPLFLYNTLCHPPRIATSSLWIIPEVSQLHFLIGNFSK